MLDADNPMLILNIRLQDHQANADLEHFPEATHAPIHKQHAQYNHREPRKRAVIIGCR